jgi:cell cycle sensor histidine kinase DivJ
VGAHHSWQIHISDEAQVVTADARLIGLILQNLLSNAIKFSEAGSSITLSASVENDELMLRVRDSGIGILPDERARVFEPFFRGSNFDERAGLGLGLSIVRDAVAKHEGHIHLESTPGAGTTIDIYLPLADAARS